MNIAEFMNHLQKKNVKLYHQDGKIKMIGPRDEINADLKSQIKEHKQALIQFLIHQEEVWNAPIPKAQESTNEMYPLSRAQKRMYILHQMDDQGIAYNIPMAVKLTGPLELDLLEEAIGRVIERHEALRTSFVDDQGEPAQKIRPQIRFKLDFSERNESDLFVKIKQFIRPFDLKQAPLLRAELVRLDQDQHVLLMDMHHIVSDGMSFALFLNELAELYSGKALTPAAIQYKDYVAWEKAKERSGAQQKQETYWLDTLSGELPQLQMPLDYARPPEQNVAGQRIVTELDQELTRNLQRLADEHDVTMYMLLLSAYTVLLSKYTGQKDIIVGTPIAGRSHDHLKSVIGLFTNTIATRHKIEPDQTFDAFLNQVRRHTLSAYENQDYPFDELIEKLNLPIDRSRHTLFDTMFDLQHAEDYVFQLGQLQAEMCEFDLPVSKFDLSLSVIHYGSHMKLDLQYASKLFAQNSMERFLSHLVNVLNEIVLNAGQKVSQLRMLSRQEEEQVLYQFNSKRVDSYQGTLNDWFEERAAHAPERIAVVHGNRSMSYEQLNERVNKLARLLRMKGVKPNSIVGVMVERSLDMIVGILAVLKAGAAYLPIDPELPDDRILYMLRDSEAVLLLNGCPLRGKIRITSELAMEDPEIERMESSNPERVNHQGDLAYVIYTSGSTGTPKGVMTTHGNVLNYISAFLDRVPLTEEDAVLQVVSFSFDAFTEEVFPLLAVSGRIVLSDKLNETHVDDLVMQIEKENITVLSCSPLLLNELDKNRHLRPHANMKFISGGDVLKYEYVRNMVRSAQVYNSYGPTEATVCATYYRVMPQDQGRVSIPIGSPLGNVDVFILDEYQQPVPIGVAGELYIGGAGVAKGYLHLAELTQSRFIDHLLVSGNTMYRTGDMGRWLPDGTIEFLGRNDEQIKIRGYRVEIREVEHHLAAHPDVSDAVVTDQKDPQGQLCLCAYIVWNSPDHGHGFDELKTHARERLPAYMIPSWFMSLEKIPRTLNGKADLNVLPKPNMESTAHTTYAAPSNELECILASIWEEVLDLRPIGVDHHFFELGGQSLRAFAMMSAIQRKLDIRITLKDIFNMPTIRELAAWLQTVETQHTFQIQKATHKPHYPLSAAQRRLYILDRVQQTGLMYNMPLIIRLSKEAEQQRMEQTLLEIIRRHEGLRTSFTEMDDGPVQRIHAQVNFNLLVGNGLEQDLDSFIHSFIQPFDLEKAPLFRAALWRTEISQYLCLDMHHLISDAVSMDILIQEIGQIYEHKRLAPLTLQYKDYAEWSLAPEQQEQRQEHQQYWTDVLKGELPVLNLPLDFSRPAIQSHEGNRLQFAVDSQLTQRLRLLAAENGVTLFVLLLTAYTILLARYTSQDDIIIGTTVAGREHPELEDMVGMFVNTLALRFYPEPDMTVQQLLHHIKDTTLDGFSHQDYPFDELVSQLEVKRDASRSPLFDTLFTLQAEKTIVMDANGLLAEYYPFSHPTAKFDLSVTALETADGIEMFYGYASRLFKQDTMERLAGHYNEILKDIVNGTQCTIGEINLVTEKERQLLLHQFNNNARDYANRKPVPEQIADHGIHFPNKVAVVYDGQKLTYSELNERAADVAEALQELGVHKQMPVGIMMDRSLEMMVGLLGILKAGGAYMPLDPAFPEDRIRYMLEDSGASVVVTQEHLLSQVKKYSHSIKTLVLDSSWSPLQSIEEKGDRQARNGVSQIKHDDHDLAYIIYTSGSTGLPKGVLIEHGSFANFCYGFIEAQQITERDRAANYLQITFDGSIIDIFPALVVGAELHIIPSQLRLDMSQLNAYMNAHSITLITLPPKVCEVFIHQPNTSLRLLIAGGEQLKLSFLPDYPLINAYGPTENTVATTYQRVDQVQGNIPIGKPLPNIWTYVMNSDHQLCPVGVTGELYIAGNSVARGYLNNPELTAEKFVDNPHEPGGKMYRTGDLVRWLPDGSLQFMGRTDQQVKIRGYRIELGEIEQQLLKHPAIREAAVLAHQDPQGNGALCAYVVTEGETVWTAATVRDWLEAELPDYMIPAYVVQLEQLPLTSHGKLDRKALPEPDHHLPAGPETEAPRSEVERILVDVWRDVLNMEELGINHQFFVSGGDSIKALQIGSRLARAGLRMEVRDLFAYPKIRDLSPYVKWDQRERRSQEPVEGEVQLTPIQQWFFANNTAERSHFTQSFMLHRAAGFKPDVLEQVLDRLLEHHDALRMRYEVQADGSIRQINRPAHTGERMYTLHRFDIRGWDEPERQVYEAATRVQQACNLEEGKLVQVGWFEAEDGDHLLLAIHHLVVDGVSWRILLEDMEVLYQQAERGEELDAGEKTDSYKRFAEALQDYANSPGAAKERAYWSRLAAEGAGLNLGERKETAGPDRFADSHTLQSTLSAEVTQQLLRESNRAYQTEINDLLLSALYLAVRKLTGELKLKVNLEGHGREDVLEGIDVSRTVGWFTTLYPVLLEGEAEDELSTTIKRVKEGLRKVPHKGFSYGALKYVARMPELQAEKKAPILFNYLGEIGASAQSGWVHASHFKPGESMGDHIARTNPIELNASIYNGSLTLSTTYTKAAFSEEMILNLNQNYIEALEQVVQHCVNKEHAEKTSSDYGFSDLSLEDLEDLLSEYELIED